MAKSKSKVVQFLKAVEFLKQEGFKKFSLSEEDEDYVLKALEENTVGVCVFVVNGAYQPMNYDEFLQEAHITAVSRNFGEETLKNGDMQLKEGRIFFVGSDKELKSRIREHITAAKPDKNISLKLGCSTRMNMKKYLDVYVHSYDTIDEARKIKKYLRKKFGAYFGQR